MSPFQNLSFLNSKHVWQLQRPMETGSADHETVLTSPLHEKEKKKIVAKTIRFDFVRWSVLSALSTKLWEWTVDRKKFESLKGNLEEMLLLLPNGNLPKRL